MDRTAETLDDLLAEIRACRVCLDQPRRVALPHLPRPVLHVTSKAKILIASQAPGTKVHASGQSFDDASGDRLRDWMGVDRATFYDDERIAIAAMGFCFPGQDGKGGDLPPRPECAVTWHDRLFAARAPFELIIAVGASAQAYHLRRMGLQRFTKAGLTERVMGWREIYEAHQQPRILTLPHPSWRNTGWLKRNPWFAQDLLPVLRADVARLSATGSDAG